MKRIFLLVVIGLLLAGCGLVDTAPENLSNAVSMGWDEGVEAIMLDNEVLNPGESLPVWTDTRPLAGTNVAQVIFRVEMDEDVLNLGEEAPVYLYGAGLIELQDEEAAFQNIDQISAQGGIQLRAFQPSAGSESAMIDWLMEPGNMFGFGRVRDFSPTLADALETGSTGQTTMGFFLTGGYALQTAVLTNNENITTLADFQCEGRMVPHSNRAQLTYFAITDDERVLIGSGIGLFNDMPAADSATEFTCNLEGEAGIVFRGTVEGVEGAQLVDMVIEGLKVQTENGQSSSFDEVAVYGFNIGMPPTFNIGMPPGGNAAWGTILTDFNIGMPPN